MGVKYLGPIKAVTLVGKESASALAPFEVASEREGASSCQMRVGLPSRKQPGCTPGRQSDIEGKIYSLVCIDRPLSRGNVRKELSKM